MSALPAASKTLFGCQSMESNGGPDGLLEQFRDPPVALLVKRADCDSSDNNVSPELEKRTAPWIAPSSASNGELVFKWAPPHERGGTIDIEQHQSRLPLQPAGFGGGCLSPHVCVPILRSGDDPV